MAHPNEAAAASALLLSVTERERERGTAETESDKDQSISFILTIFGPFLVPWQNVEDFGCHRAFVRVTLGQQHSPVVIYGQ